MTEEMIECATERLPECADRMNDWTNDWMYD